VLIGCVRYLDVVVGQHRAILVGDSNCGLVSEEAATACIGGLIGRADVLKLSPQEEELIEVVRHPNSQDFTLTITLKSGHWYVGLHAPQTSRQRSDGDGATFLEAWDDLKPSWA
jgi:hypothetical protein